VSLLIKAIIPVLLAGFLTTGALTMCRDYDDSVIQELHYCNMVAIGDWPNFKPEIKCGEKDD